MKRCIPPIIERPEELKALLKSEHDVKCAQRIQMLYLLASQQVRTRKDVAAILGVHRETVGTWLDRYTAGGLPALLERAAARGKKPSVTPTIEAELRALLNAAPGFQSYQAIVDWLWRQHHIRLSYSAVYALVRRKLKVQLGARQQRRKRALSP